MNDTYSTKLFALFAKFLLVLFLFVSFGKIANSQNSKHLISEISIVGNKKTKEKVILRELTFHALDSVSDIVLQKQIKESKSNLQNTSLFNFVTIEVEHQADSTLKIRVELTERWYLWPDFLVRYSDRNLSNWLHTKDWSRIYYGGGLKQKNFRGRNQQLSVGVVAGYYQRLSLHLSNLYLDKDFKQSLTLYAEYARQHNLAYDIENNAEISVKLDDEYAHKSQKYELSYMYRPFHKSLFRASVSYNSIQVHDTVVALNPAFLNNNTNSAHYLNLIYNYSYENRDKSSYPLSGSFFNFNLNINGLGMLPNETYSHHFASLDYRYYYPLADRLFFAQSFFVSVLAGKQTADLFFRALGYDAGMRGFDHQVIEAKHYMTFKNNLKFSIIKPQVFNLKFIPTEKFSKIHFAMYSNLILDFGYVNNPIQTELANQLLFSYGVGLDLVTYYDKVIRLDFINSPQTGFGFYVNSKIAF